MQMEDIFDQSASDIEEFDSNNVLESMKPYHDMNEDEVRKYNPGDILPVFIFFKDDIEIKRIFGEIKEEELVKIIEELGINEKNC